MYAGRRFNSGNITNKLITFKALKYPYLILGWWVGLGDPTPYSNFRGGRGLSNKHQSVKGHAPPEGIAPPQCGVAGLGGGPQVEAAAAVVAVRGRVRKSW